MSTDSALQQRMAAAHQRSAVLAQRSRNLVNGAAAEVATLNAALAAMPERLNSAHQDLAVEVTALREDTACLLRELQQGRAEADESLRSAARSMHALAQATNERVEALGGLLRGVLEELHSDIESTSSETLSGIDDELAGLLDTLRDELMPDLADAISARAGVVEDDSGNVDEQVRGHAEAFSERLTSAWDEFEQSLTGNIEEVSTSLGQLEDQARELSEQIEQIISTMAEGRRTMDSAVETTQRGAGGAMQVVTDTIDIFRQVV